MVNMYARENFDNILQLQDNMKLFAVISEDDKMYIGITSLKKETEVYFTRTEVLEWMKRRKAIEFEVKKRVGELSSQKEVKIIYAE